MEIDPASITGPWKAGYTLALHTVKSEFLGHDEQGRPRFDTTRSAVGEALYQLKYQSSATAAAKLARVTAEFVLKKGFPVDLVVALPPSKKRLVQPVALIAEEVAKRPKVPYDSKGLRKVKDTPELKSLTDLKERKKALKGAYVPSARTLLEAGEAAAVYALALTRTRTNR